MLTKERERNKDVGKEGEEKRRESEPMG